MKLKKGLVHVYTGDGRGKTSAGLMIALRAAQQGLRVAIIQFIKQIDSSEKKAFEKRFPEVEFLTCGEGFYKILGDRKPASVHQAKAQQAFEVASAKIASGNYDVVILDELNLAIDFGLIPVDLVIRMIRNRPQHVEIVITGRNTPEKLIDLADYVSDIRKIKHPYDQGIKARKGIDF